MRAIARMTEMLTLPSRIAVHTPFTVCMIATSTIAHLSACKYVLEGEDLQVARERIRVAMGALESFAEVWPRGKRVTRELKTVARELLSLAPASQGQGSSGDQSIQLSFLPLIESNSPYVNSADSIGVDPSDSFDFPLMEADISSNFGCNDWILRTGFSFDVTAQY
jgi:hypothetical protein